jgi:cation transport ATPase
MPRLLASNTVDNRSDSEPIDSRAPNATRPTGQVNALERPRSGMTNAGDGRGQKTGTSRGQVVIAGLIGVAIGLHLLLRFGVGSAAQAYGIRLTELPLIAALIFGGVPLFIGLAIKLLRQEFSSDLLAGISIVTSIVLEDTWPALSWSSCLPEDKR